MAKVTLTGQTKLQLGAGAHVGIAGAGLMGRMLAWQLALIGYRVSLFDKDAKTNGSAAAYTAAGMLTPFAEMESAETLIYQLGQRSLELWPELIAILNSDIRYTSNGSLVVAHAQDHVEMAQFTRHVKQKIPVDDSEYQELDHDGLQRLEPQLAEQFQRALYLPTEAWVCAEEVMHSLAQNCEQLGVEWHENCEIRDVQPGAIIGADKTTQVDCAIDCRGMGAKPQLSDLRGVRGEVIWLEAKDVKISRPVRLMHPRYRLYLVPQQRDDLYILGASQIESNDYSPVSVRSCLELLSAAYSLSPQFGEARVLDMRANCRPAFKHNQPEVHTEAGLVRVNGLFRHGYLMAPAITEALMQVFVADSPQTIITPNLFTSAA